MSQLYVPIFPTCFTLNTGPFGLGSWKLSKSQGCSIVFLLPLDGNMMFDLSVNNIGHEKISKWFQVPLINL